jgi:hypothetical protein
LLFAAVPSFIAVSAVLATVADVPNPAANAPAPTPALSAPPSPSRHPDAAETYTLTSTLELVPPFRLEDMADDFQDVRVLSRNAQSCTVEITYYPLHRPAIGENRNWRKDYAGMTEYLRPTAAENWNDDMRRDLLIELRAAGIEPDDLTDRELVERVARWAMKRSRSTSAFSIWGVYFVEDQATVFPALRSAFNRQKPNAKWTDQQMFDEEVLGRAMYYNKVRGSCTSSSIYLTTIFRALGIPTRTVFCIPPFDVNDPNQAAAFYGAIHHHQVRETVRGALEGMQGFLNHLFNEVFVGGRWVRLNYSTLGQPILDKAFFGLLTHIYTSADLSREPIAETWGRRYFQYPGGQPRLSSVNPYRLLSVHDQFGGQSEAENTFVPPPPELTTATIVGLLRWDAPSVPSWIANPWKAGGRHPDFLLCYKEWLTNRKQQMRIFQEKVGAEFVLSAPGQPDLHAKLIPSRFSQGDGSFQAYGLDLVAADRSLIAPGVAYTLRPVNISETYRWQLSPDFLPVTLQDIPSDPPPAPKL